MSVSTAVKRCGAKTRSGGVCAHAAGHGTDHVGRGRCKFHGGCTPDHRKAATREEAQERGYEFARGQLGAAVEIDPLDAQLLSVHLAHGVVEFWRAKLAAEGSAASVATVKAYGDALADFNRFSKSAVDAGIAERLVNVAERAGEQVTLVCEEALAALVAAGVSLTNAQRAIYARAVGAGLRQFEDEPKQLGAGVA